MTKPAPFRYFKTSPEIIRLAVMMYVRFPLSLRNVEDLLHERGIDVSHETVRYWWNRFGPMFASEIRRKRVQQLRAYSKWKWHVDEVFVKINGKRHYLWRAVDHEGEVLEAVVTKRRNKRAALKFLRKLMKRHGRAEEIVTDRFASYRAALQRALRNYLETFPAFAALALALAVSELGTDLSATGAALWFWARVVYIPAFASGIPLVRSVAWFVSIGGIVLMLIPFF